MHDRDSVFRLFLEVEKSHSLWERKTEGGVFFWKVIRAPLFESVLVSLGLMERPEGENAEEGAARSLFLDSLNSLYRCRRRLDAIVIENSRKVRRNGEYVDPYTERLVHDLVENGTRHVLAEDGINGHLDPSKRNRRYHGDSVFDKWIRFKVRMRGDPLDRATSDLLTFVFEELSRGLGVPVAFGKTGSRLRRFLAQREYWRKVLRSTGAKTLYLVCSYGKEGIIDAARERGARVVELQHGIVNDTHPGYSFGRTIVPYFPDVFLSFGTAWCGPFFPSGATSREVIGYRYLNELVAPYRGLPKEESVVFLSQWAITSRLLAYAGALKAARPDLDLVFKFHPREKDSTVESCRARFPGMRFIKNETPLYDLLARAKWTVGVFSTATIEALAFRCRLALVEAPGLEAMRALIEDLSIPVARGPEELAGLFDAADGPTIRFDRLDRWLQGLDEGIACT